MAVELSRLMKKVSHMDITLLAGEQGLSNMVSWVHMIETKEASSFLEGGEIAFTTGIGLNNGLSILDLVENIWENNASGIVLNIGPFLERIPQEIIDFGNSHDFPIFSVPWKIHIAEIMRIFSSMITKSEQANLEIAAAFKNAIFFPKQEELFVVPLSQHGFHINWNYYTCVIRIIDSAQNTISQKRLENICLDVDNHLQHRKYKKFAIFYNENQLIAITGNYSEEMMNSFTNDMHEYLSRYLQKNEQFFISIGKCTKSIRCLYKSYHQALSIQNFMENKKDSSNMLAYSNMGIYKLLMGVEDNEILEEYYEKTIQPLIEYDQKNNSDLANVLWTYLRNDGSVKETADELFVHRNTINYKLNRVAEILDMNLSSLDTRLQLTLGFMLQDML
ncbi:PucR family transcriptional regulator [Roseburia sp. 499]|uniref:PucR family transcriptional regulator n=1 Tax=Roseburia sp. 499 TaxID=1261634 RepID=UPI000952829E|nr:PucR family transcriptional regulator [Roseburia sp. 499]WVK70267.1 PucR family transcriptional regulator [Roseburia sp. 499]